MIVFVSTMNIFIYMSNLNIYSTVFMDYSFFFYFFLETHVFSKMIVLVSTNQIYLYYMFNLTYIFNCFHGLLFSTSFLKHRMLVRLSFVVLSNLYPTTTTSTMKKMQMKIYVRNFFYFSSFTIIYYYLIDLLTLLRINT